MHTAEKDYVLIRNNPNPSQWDHADTLVGRSDIAGDKLRGNKVGRVFVSDQFKVLLWWGANILAVTTSALMSSSADTTPFDARVWVV